jgi:outer membrane immunogenic protein
MRLLAGVFAVALAAWSGVACAQPVFNWTGFYVGVQTGGAWASQDWTQIDNNQGNPLDRSASPGHDGGILGGLQAGYNHQLGRWVVGLEGEWVWADLETCARLSVFSTFSNCTRTGGYGTFTGRAGYTWERLLAYVKGGAALTTAKYYAVTDVAGGSMVDTETTRKTSWGWTVGAGVEYALAPRWSVRLEYGYLDFGRQNVSLVYLPGGTDPGLVETWEVRNSAHVVKVGVNYRLSGPN